MKTEWGFPFLGQTAAKPCLHVTKLQLSEATSDEATLETPRSPSKNKGLYYTVLPALTLAQETLHETRKACGQEPREL